MNLVINNFNVEILEENYSFEGLKFKPQMKDYDNNHDWTSFTKRCSSEVSDNNYNTVKSIVNNYYTHGIIEIGVHRNGEKSFTTALLADKPDDIKYLGIDLGDKSYMNDKEKNIFTIQENSYSQQIIRDYLKEIGLEKISILFIDGDHSVNTVINDFLFSDLLSENGIIILNDTNYHPGPSIIINCIDENIYRVERYCVENDDYGLAILYKK